MITLTPPPSCGAAISRPGPGSRGRWPSLSLVLSACLVPLPAMAAQPQPLRTVAAAPAAPGDLQLLDTRKIWDRAPHNAFTDLVRFQGRWFCTFREGAGHVSPDGALRVITSLDGERWESAALLTAKDADLRDPKLVATTDGRLMLHAAAALHDKSSHSHQSVAWFSSEGRTYGGRIAIGEPNFWLWRIAWHRGKTYGVGYGCGRDQSVRWYASDEGRDFPTRVERLFETGYPNETGLVFAGDRVYCLLRRDGTPNTGLLGLAEAPYTKWRWLDLGTRIGGPALLGLPDGRLLAAVRLYDGKVRTALCWVDPHQGRISESLSLPSGGDTSYAGLVLHEDTLWVSYYSSHEGKTAIYLAKVRVRGEPPRSAQ